MNNQATNNMAESDVMQIDLLDLLKLLWRKLWIIILSMVLCGSIAFASSIFLVAPKYTASAMMYVNNNSLSAVGGTITFSSSQLSAAKSLLDVYVIILKSRPTLEAAIEKADLDYTYGELRKIVSAGSVDNTEIFTITATCSSAADAELIVDTLVDILPDRISDIVDGSSVRLVEHAILPTARSSPSYTRYGIIGIIIGALLSCAAIILQDLMNNTVRDEEYLKQRYNIPILAIVPDAYGSSGKSYGYKYGYKSKYRYGYHTNGGYYSKVHEKKYEESYESARKNVQDGEDK